MPVKVSRKKIVSKSPPRAAAKKVLRTPIKPKSTKIIGKPQVEIKHQKDNHIPERKLVKPLHVGIAGNIGAGKTTLTSLLAKNLKWEPHYEDTNDNPYLTDFYNDMQRWSFNLQMYFLNSRFRHVLKIRESSKTIIQDRTIYEDAYIFAPNLHSMGLMTTRDYQNYLSMFDLMRQFITPPDLLIYLRGTVPTLVNQIQKRGRNYETAIRLDYLKRLNERYEAWITSYELGKLLVIDIDHINFEENPEDLGNIINKINSQINGLF